MIYVLLVLILLLSIYFGLFKKHCESFIIYNKANDDSKPVGINFSNYNIYYEKIVNGVKLTGSYNVGGENINFDNNGKSSKLMTLEQLKKTAEILGDERVGIIVIDESNGSLTRNSVFLKSVTESLSDPLSLEKNLDIEQKNKYKNELANYPKNTSFIKKFSKKIKEQNIPDMKDARFLFSKNDCKIIDDSKNDIINYKGTLDECKVKCASYADCQGFNRGKDVFDINNAECILKKIYHNKEGACIPDDKYISYSRGGQIKYEIWEIKERERIERERIEKERREREERERKERERIEKERREREERERREREERERREREEREKREREEREINERERNMVVYNNNTYKTLADWDKNDYNVTCQNSGYSGQRSYIDLPNGWSIAPDNQDSIRVIKSKPWKTHVLVVSNGNGYWTATYPQGDLWSRNLLNQSGNSFMPGNCHLGILLIKNK